MLKKIILVSLGLFPAILLSAQINQPLAPKAPPTFQNPKVGIYKKPLNAIPPPVGIASFPSPPSPPKKPRLRLVKSQKRLFSPPGLIHVLIP